ncbi:MAG: hypothetical protein NTY19_00485 [Planctomycetota bacterium]|nr:hypothetical protein [Planctomycetota bacterium]
MNLTEKFPLSLAERPLRFPATQTDPVKLVQEELARLHGEHLAVSDGLLVQLAQACFHVARVRAELAATGAAAAEEALAIIAANLQDVLTAHQTRAEDWTGQVWTAAMRGDVDLRGHQVREGLTEPRVAYMELPVVFRAGRRIAKGAASLETPPRQD